ncbi:MAG: hypothetical protein S4CHLAM20_07970 [Chlamydiia bacterium]|nr:hypothetical protein [Chlamydiia bacterium]
MVVDEREMFVERLAGTGEMNFVLIHNAGSSHRFFTHQVEMLREFGDVIWLDLPGSGESEVISSYKMEDLAKIIEKICGEMSLDNICLIGLNNGSNVAIETTLRGNIKLKNLIVIDPPIFMDHSFKKEIEGFIQCLKKKEFDEKFIASLVDALFLNTEASNKEIAMSAFNSVDHKSLEEIFEGLLEWDARADGRLEGITCPTLCILTDEHHCTYEKIKKQAPEFEIGKVIGSRCWATLEVPEQVNAMIKRFLNLHQSNK